MVQGSGRSNEDKWGITAVKIRRTIDVQEMRMQLEWCFKA
jgi:hypothetical protein